MTLPVSDLDFVLEYKKTDTLTNLTAKKEVIYDSKNKQSLCDIINEVKNSIELKAIDMINDTAEILKDIQDRFYSCLLHKADYVYIVNRDITVLKMENVEKPNTEYSILITIKGKKNWFLRKNSVITPTNISITVSVGICFVGLYAIFLDIYTRAK